MMQETFSEMAAASPTGVGEIAGAECRASSAMTERRGNGTLRRRILWLVAAVNVASTIVACAIAYNFQKQAFLHGIDRVLIAGARGAQHIHDDEFQQLMLAGQEFTPEEELLHLKQISSYANQLRLNYLGALVERDGRYFYTVTSSPDHEFVDGTFDRMWTEYTDVTPALRASFRDGQVRFEEHEDRYGSFRSAYVPFRNSGEGKVGYVYVADIGLDMIYGHLHRTLAKTAFAGLLISVVSLWMTWLLAGHVTRPLVRLANMIRQVIVQDFGMQPEQRSAIAWIAEQSHEEVSHVARAFCKMESRLEEYLVELQATTAERERMASELSIAHDIQMGLLPRELPLRENCDVFARVIPAKEVGGDLFDVVMLDEHRMLLVVADVSGKGIPGGMFMAVTKTLLDAATASCTNPAEIVRFLNDRLCAQNDACMFVTMFLAVLDTRTGCLEYTNAGHNPPYLRHDDGTLEMLSARHGMATGIAAGQDYGSDTLTLRSDDLLLIYSDGITEAQDCDEQLFDESRLEACLANVGHEAAGEVAADVIQRVMEFQGTAPQADDITILALRYAAGVSVELELAGKSSGAER
ncbi:PP2C family protein-serine/threonine phosphatase [Candidatus Laterigemmans baculatus]|uniref:PP2C family protein-serine/threonine phosphatase n=1 Tax=Candidatus Laterigemmans baculatus TaxID=2770505 RepID=UPI0013DC11C9|nr:PP2C family protein-serine/threonine phosphatase [Candidatus Laterigemmans baculatus]